MGERNHSELYNPYPRLPKNIRQIGDRDQIVKLYVEDYVNTYLKKLYPVGGQDLRVGILLGNLEVYEGTPYVFIDGALELDNVTTDGEKVEFTDADWKKAYQNMEQMFPKRAVQGWFLCGTPETQLSPLNYWKQHGQYFSEKNQLMYLNRGMEGEESIYITSEDGFYKLQGHSIYYERNQMMQDYMVLRKDARRVEVGVNDSVTRDFRVRMVEKKAEATERRSQLTVLKTLCSALSIAVMAGGIVMFNNYGKMKEMESVIASAMPQITSKIPYQENEPGSGVMIEEMPGEVYPTKEEVKSAVTGEAYTAAQVSSDAPTQGSVEETLALEEAETPQQESAVEAAVTESTAVQAAEQDISQGSIAPDLQDVETAAANAEEQLPQAAQVSSIPLYTVGEGETLFGICFKIYGDLDQLQRICELNGLDDQDRIISGQQLILP